MTPVSELLKEAVELMDAYFKDMCDCRVCKNTFKNNNLYKAHEKVCDAYRYLQEVKERVEQDYGSTPRCPVSGFVRAKL